MNWLFLKSKSKILTKLPDRKNTHLPIEVLFPQWDKISQRLTRSSMTCEDDQHRQLVLLAWVLFYRKKNRDKKKIGDLISQYSTFVSFVAAKFQLYKHAISGWLACCLRLFGVSRQRQLKTSKNQTCNDTTHLRNFWTKSHWRHA